MDNFSEKCQGAEEIISSLKLFAAGFLILWLYLTQMSTSPLKSATFFSRTETERGGGGEVKDHFKLFFTKSFVLAGDGFSKMRMSNESGTMKADELNCLPSLAGC